MVYSDPFRIWRMGNVTGGTTYTLNRSLTYASVRSAGHMVPQTQPELA